VHVHSERDPFDASHPEDSEIGVDTPLGWAGIREHGYGGEGPTLYCRAFPDDPRCA
jgi:hypothetical protein